MTNITFLAPKKGTSTKTFEYKNGSWKLLSNYKAGKFFFGHTDQVDSLDDFFDILEINQEHNCFMIHGSIIDGTDTKNMVRRKRAGHEDNMPPTITDRNIQLFCVDVDGYTGTIAELIKELPKEFHTADFVYQYSASYALTEGEEVLKCHLFFWLDKPIHNTELKAWMKSYNMFKKWGNVLDDSVLNAAQPIYTQKRICKGAPDPVDTFVGIIKKDGPLSFDPSEIVVEKEKSRTKIPVNTNDRFDLRESVSKILTAEDYHQSLNGLALSLINRQVPANTVKSLLEGAMNAAEKKDARWQERYNDIGRAVDSAVDIVSKPTIEDLIDWIDSTPKDEVICQYAQRCVELSPMDKATAIQSIVEKTGFGMRTISKTITLATEEYQKEQREKAKQAKTAEREAAGIYELEYTAESFQSICDRACRILAKSDKKPEVFSMGGSLAVVENMKPKTIRQCSKLAHLKCDYPKMPCIRHFKKPFSSLYHRMMSDMIFVDSSGNAIEPPAKVLQYVGEANDKSFKPLTGVIEHPFMDNTWTAIKKQGYDEKTGLYAMLHHKLKLTPMKAKDAYQYLTDVVFDEFPFESDFDKALAVAAMMTAVQRPMISGDTGFPGFGIVSPTQSSGKTTLAQLISYSVFNRPVAATNLSSDDNELEKRLLAILQEGHSCILFDNIQQGAAVTSNSLASVITSDSFRGRQLGESRTVEVPTNVLWMFTGNGISFVGDFAERIIPIRINPLMENPHQRRFKRENIGQWAMDNRKHIMSAILSVIYAGKNMEPTKLGSRFKEWDKFVRMPLLKVTGMDIAEAFAHNREDDDDHRAKINLLELLSEQFGDKRFTTRQIVSLATEGFEGENKQLLDAIKDISGDMATNANSLGRQLKAMVGAVFGNYTLQSHKSNVVRWRVATID